MHNFNVKYECHDARDDFHQQKLAKEKNAQIPSWCDDTTVDHIDHEIFNQTILDNLDTNVDFDEIPEEYKIVSKGTTKRNEKMQEMTSVLVDSGWLSACIDEIQFDKSNFTNIEATQLNTGQNYLATRKNIYYLQEKITFQTDWRQSTNTPITL